MTKFFTRILLIIAGAMLIAGAVFAQNNTNTRQIRFFPVVTAADTAETSANQGRVWYDFSTDHFRANIAGTNTMFGEGSGGSFWATTGTTSVTTPTISGAVTFSGGKTTFTPDATNAGLNVGSFAGNPSSLSNGDVWYNSSTDRFNIMAASETGTVLWTSNPTANRVPFYFGTNGELESNSLFTFGSSTLTVPLIRLTSNATSAGLNVGSFAGDPSTLSNGDIWYNSSSGNLRARIGGSSVSLGSGVGGSTGSTDNAILRADGTGGSTVQSSAVTIDDTGSAIWGLSATTGTARDQTVVGSETNIDFRIITKGAGGVHLFGNYLSVLNSTNPLGAYTAAIYLDAFGPNINAVRNGAFTPSTSHFIIRASTGNSTSGDGQYMRIKGGDGYSVGDNDGGHVFLLGGEKANSGIDGNIGLFTTTADFGGGEQIAHWHNAEAVPTTDPTDGVLVYGEGGALKARGTSGTITTMAPADPHCPSCGSDFVCEYENEKYGYLAMCFKCMAENMNKPKRKRKPFFTTTKGAWSTHK